MRRVNLRRFGAAPRQPHLVSILVVLLFNAISVRASLVQVPGEIASNHFLISINGETTPVMHAAQNCYFLNFEMKKRVTVTVTADADDFWARGVEVQPWRLGIRPRVAGRTIAFTLDRPGKLSITRPNDYLGGAEMLFLFANAPETDAATATTPGVRYFGPGVHRENIDAGSGDRIYLAPGAVIFGALNVWSARDVRVWGRGVIVYDGPQNPADDDGWMHRRNWHAIVMHEAQGVSIEGITCVVRSRTWMIQMRDSRDIHYVNVKVIGGSPGNANQDGMDWLGGGDTTVRDSFFRAADDIFAMQGNWEGYGPAAFAIPGHDVTNIVIEGSVLSTSISNVVRAGWPHKNFNSNHFVLRDSDVIHMGIGGCGVPFALMEFWGDPEATGHHSDYLFENIRMDDWYSLTQLRQPADGLRDIRFRDIFGLELPSLVPSTLLGSVSGVQFDNVALAAAPGSVDASIPVKLFENASAPAYTNTGPVPAFSYSAGLIAPGEKVHFDARGSHAGAARIVRFEWSFGDGAHATGSRVKHRFPDEQGTLWDGSGRFRVLLHTVDAAGRHGWAYQPVVVATTMHPADAATAANTQPGVWVRESGLEQHDGASAPAEISPQIDNEARERKSDYLLRFNGLLEVPADGGYSFTLVSNDAGQIAIDGVLLARSPKPWPQVCGSAGNAAQARTGSIALGKGRHRIDVVESHSAGEDNFRVLWQGPGVALSTIPASALSHASAMATGTGTAVVTKEGTH